jgi:endonuclease G, mitochondrial
MSEKSVKITRFLEWIAPSQGNLESLAGDSSYLGSIGELPWATEEDAEQARRALGRLARSEDISEQDENVLEAIVLPKERPVVDIVNGTFVAPAVPFEAFGDGPARRYIESAIPAIGRIDLPDHPYLPYGGTGFVVGDGILMTNRHVAELFASGIGREELGFRPGQTAAVDFLHERGSDLSRHFRIQRIAMIHPYWDMALLVVEGLDDVRPLVLSVVPPGDLQERMVAVIGYPALDPRNNVELQNTVFRGVFNVKRLQPGRLRDLRGVQSFGHPVSAVTHDASTLGGNSGSAVIDVETGTVVGLHFAGVYLEANYAVPAHELALDGRIVEAGVKVEQVIAQQNLPWDNFWIQADPAPLRRTASASTKSVEGLKVTDEDSPTTEDRVMSWSLPLEIVVQVRSQAQTVGTSEAESMLERIVEPFHDEDLSGRKGYDSMFLGPDGPETKQPTVLREELVSRLDDGSYVLPYEHFSIVMNRERRLAMYTASNVDANRARKEPEANQDYTRRGLSGLGKSEQEKWFTDPRIPAIHQLPDRFFTRDRGAFDKGHIVRREDVAWGQTYSEVRRANGDTYHVTNCSPQVAGFNRSTEGGLWGQLEDLVLRQARVERYCVFAGPVLLQGDPVFCGVDEWGSTKVAVPRQFWKIIVANGVLGPQTFAFLLDQDLSAINLEFAVYAPWRSRMISVSGLEKLMDYIRFPDLLHDTDQSETPSGETVRFDAGLEMYQERVNTSPSPR